MQQDAMEPWTGTFAMKMQLLHEEAEKLYTRRLESYRKEIEEVEQICENLKRLDNEQEDKLKLFHQTQLEQHEKNISFNKTCIKMVQDAYAEYKRAKPLAVPFAELLRFEDCFPVYPFRPQITQLLDNHSNIVVSAETGSGKSSQVPQYVMEHLQIKCKPVLVVQPRGIAVKSLCKYVKNFTSQAGLWYDVDIIPKSCDLSDTPTLYYTSESVFLDYIKTDPQLTRISAIIIDEVHERTIYTDVILGILKDIQTSNSDLKVLLMSASLDSELLSEFLQCAQIKVPGRRFPVKTVYEPLPPSSDVKSLVQNAAFRALSISHELLSQNGLFQLWNTDRDAAIQVIPDILGTVLVFLPSRKDCENAFLEFKRIAVKDHMFWHTETDDTGLPVPLCPVRTKQLFRLLDQHPFLVESSFLHGGLRPSDQEAALALPTHRRVVKVIFTTNIAETALTIPNVAVVLDYGLENVRYPDMENKSEFMKLKRISKSSAEQRRGRVGRTRVGLCVRCYPESSLVELHEAEILRSSLELFYLKVLHLGFDPFALNLPSAPEKARMDHARSRLLEMNAISSRTMLTPLGNILAQSPLSPVLTLLTLELIKEGFSYAPAIAAGIYVGASFFFFGWTEEQREECHKEILKYECIVQTKCDTLIISVALMDMLLKKFKKSFMVDSKINVKYAQTARHVFLQLSDLFLQHTEHSSGEFPKSLEDVKKVLPLLQSLLLKHFPSQVAVLSRVRVRDDNSFDFVYQNVEDPDMELLVDWLVPPSNPVFILHYLKKRLPYEGSNRAYLSEVTLLDDCKDIPHQMVESSLWTTSVLGKDRMTGTFLSKLVLNRTQLEKREIFILSPKEIRDIDPSTYEGDPLKLIPLIPDMGITLMHLKGIDPIDTLKSFCHSEILFHLDSQGMTVLSDGLKVSRIISVAEDYCDLMPVEKAKAPSLKGSGKLMRISDDSTTLFLNTDGMPIEEIEYLRRLGGTFTGQKSSGGMDDYMVLLDSGETENVEVYFDSFKSAFLAKEILSSFILHLQLTKDQVNYTDFVLRGEGSLPIEVLRFHLEKHGVSYLRVWTGRKSGDRIGDGLMEDLKSNVLKIIGSANNRDIRGKFSRSSYCGVFMKLGSTEVDLLSNIPHMHVLPSYMRIFTFPPKLSNFASKAVENQLESAPKHSWKLITNGVRIECFDRNGFYKLEQMVKRILDPKYVPAKLRLRLFQLKKAKLQKILEECPTNAVVTADFWRKEIYVICTSDTEFEQTLEYLDHSSATFTYSSRKSTEMPFAFCLALELFLIDRRECFEHSKYSWLWNNFVKYLKSLQHDFMITVDVKKCAVTVLSKDKQMCFQLTRKLKWIQKRWKPSNTPNSSSFECFHVCNGKDKTYKLEHCGHDICIECLEAFMRASVESICEGLVASLQCPVLNCGCDLSLDDIQLFVPLPVLKRTAFRSLQRYTALHRDKYVHCPTAECARPLVRPVVVNGVTESSTVVTCVSCLTRVCVLCGELAHPSAICGDGGTVSLEGRQRCPVCLAITEKSDGCNHVRCALCLVHYCWKCGEYAEQSEDIYKHMKMEHGDMY